MNAQELAALIDHTLLRADATPAQIEQLCREAREHKFASVCVNPVYVSMAARWLEGSGAAVCTVAGFPLGAATTAVKSAEAREAIRLGAHEIDMVIWVGGLKSGQHAWVQEEVAELARLCRGEGALLKVIIECALLSDDEKLRACELCVAAQADFVKTSTGFGPGGATVADVRLMTGIVRAAGLGVKAAGGIRTYEDAVMMIEAGATRIGTSAGVKILADAQGVTVA